MTEKAPSLNSIAHLIERYYPEYYLWQTYPADECVTIHKVKEDWGIFSNFAPTPLVVEGKTFDTSERLFQTMKFDDLDIAREIFTCKGGGYKMKAKKYASSRREDWGARIVDAMKFCLMLKYEQSPEFRQTLEASRGKYIVEDQTSFPKKKPDTWGVKLHDGIFEGSNLLGRLLMELRDNGTLTYKLPDDALDVIKAL